MMPCPCGVRLGLSGPDGSGKTTQARLLAAALDATGSPPLSAHLYGCVLCRSLPRPMARAVGHRTRTRSGLAAAIGAAHGLVDLAEMAVRLLAGEAASRLRGLRGGRPLPLLTDRSPLDALVKHEPGPNTWTARGYRLLAARYDRILLLDAPAEELAARDGEHSAGELTETRERFARWACHLGAVVVRLDTSGQTAAAVLERVRAAALEPSTAGRGSDCRNR